jgi:FkbM family methyltransferase
LLANAAIGKYFSPAGLLLRAFLKAGQLYTRLVPDTDLEKLVRDQVSFRNRTDQSSRLSSILTRKISYLDVGARAGPPKYLLPYEQYITSYLCEPEPEEAERLTRIGYHVIDKAISSQATRLPLYVLAKAGGSSLLRPTPLREYFFEPWKSKVTGEITVETTTVGALARELDTNFDMIKLDTQGTEMDILSALGNVVPLFIVSEVSLLRMYEGQTTFYEIVEHLHERGYMIGHLTIGSHKPIYAPGMTKSALLGRGVPLHGDVLFIPDWMSENGRTLIRNNDRVYSALMLIHGMESILRLVLGCVESPNAGAVLDALSTSPAEIRS